MDPQHWLSLIPSLPSFSAVYSTGTLYNTKGRELTTRPRSGALIAICARKIYTARFVMFLMRADPLRGQVGGGCALEIEFFGRCEMACVPFGAQKLVLSISLDSGTFKV
jgi:hypothetical protein